MFAFVMIAIAEPIKRWNEHIKSRTVVGNKPTSELEREVKWRISIVLCAMNFSILLSESIDLFHNVSGF